MTRVVLATLSAALFSMPIGVFAQTYYYPEPPVAVETATPVILLSVEQLDQITAPIALYPDPLVAQVLTAATYPLDLVTAAQWARSNPNAPDTVVESQAWPPPVKALVHYPTVLDLLSGNITWAQQLGSAYLNQPTDVMDSIQRLRAQARAAGTLVTTSQQQVIDESGTIYVIPAQPDVIYVPVYDPTVVYVRREPLRFSPGCHVGLWFDLDPDWHRHYVATGVHWDRAHWERDHDLPNRHEPHRIDIHPVERHSWTRDADRTYAISSPRPEPGHRFYSTPAPRNHASAFGDSRPSPAVGHEETRGRGSLHQPAPRPATVPPATPRPAAPRPATPRVELAHPAPPGASPYPTQPAAHAQPHDEHDAHDGHDARGPR